MPRYEAESLLPLPEDWPEFGDLDGVEVRLADVEATLPVLERANVIVELPSGRQARPWRGVRVRLVDDDGTVAGES